MSRSNFKGPFFIKEELKNFKNKNATILFNDINNFFFIYNGKKFIKLKITEDMIGHKFGEFIFTRTQCRHKKKK